jgi:septation ring formation regulator EzrA
MSLIEKQNYFIKRHTYLADRNKLDTDIRNYVSGRMERKVVGYSELQHIMTDIKKHCNTLNDKHRKVKLKLSPSIDCHADDYIIHISQQLSYYVYLIDAFVGVDF